MVIWSCVGVSTVEVGETLWNMGELFRGTGADWLPTKAGTRSLECTQERVGLKMEKGGGSSRGA